MTNETAESLRLHLLVLRCQSGDEQAFARLFEWFRSRTLAHLKSLVGNDADDIQQEVWLTVYRTIGSLSNPGAFRTWLFRTTRNRGIDFLRRKKREQQLAEEAVAAVEADEPVDESEVRSIKDADVDRVLADLPPLQREVMLLRYRDDMSYAEIALIVGCPIGTVRTRLHHAKRQLLERLKRGDL